jgi:hypothetical protein
VIGCNDDWCREICTGGAAKRTRVDEFVAKPMNIPLHCIRLRMGAEESRITNAIVNPVLHAWIFIVALLSIVRVINAWLRSELPFAEPASPAMQKRHLPPSKNAENEARP